MIILLSWVASDMFMATSLITPKEIIGPAPLSILQRPVNERCFIKPTRRSQRLIPLLQQWFKLSRIDKNCHQRVQNVFFLFFPIMSEAKAMSFYSFGTCCKAVSNVMRFKVQDSQRHTRGPPRGLRRQTLISVSMRSCFVGHNSYLWDSILYFFIHFILLPDHNLSKNRDEERVSTGHLLIVQLSLANPRPEWKLPDLEVSGLVLSFTSTEQRFGSIYNYI